MELFWVCIFTVTSITGGVLMFERNRHAGCAIFMFPTALWLVIVLRVWMQQ